MGNEARPRPLFVTSSPRLARCEDSPRLESSLESSLESCLESLRDSCASWDAMLERS